MVGAGIDRFRRNTDDYQNDLKNNLVALRSVAISRKMGFSTASLVMRTVEEHEKRSQEIADTTRRVVVTLNSGGIGLVFTVAGTLTTHGTSARWALLPVGLFVVGLLFTGISLFLAKHRELKRRDAAKENKGEPEHFKKWYWRSFTWDLVAFAFFGAGAIAGLLTLAFISANP